jgi:flagellar hook-associated protein 3 FlgL
MGSAALALATVNMTTEKLAAVQAQLASQRKITKPSDDPVATAQALALRSQTTRQTAYDKSTTDAQGRLQSLDTALSGMVTLVQRAQDLTRQGLNTGTVGTDAAKALAAQLDAVRADLLRTANTTDAQGRPIFGGTTSNPTAFAADGTYQGNSAAANRVVAQGVTLTVTRDGSAIFGSGSSSVFATLDAASTAVAAGDTTGASAALDTLGDWLKQVSGAQSVVGADETRAARIADDAATQSTATAAQLSSLQDVDIAKMSIDLSSANLAYQAALSATAKTSQMSLLDFLR